MTSSDAFEVIPLGTGNFFSTRRYCTALAIFAGGRPIFVDCPDPFYRMCAEASRQSGRRIDPADATDIVLTHIHGDHSNGLEGLGFWLKFVAKNAQKPRLFALRETADALWPKLAPSMAEAVFGDRVERFALEDYFDLRIVENGGRFAVGDVEFETRRTVHSVPTFGFRATYRGRCFGYSCDTAFDPEHIEFLSKCNLIFHETDVGEMHTELKKLEALGEDLRRRMRLIHLNDRFEGSDRIEAAEEGKIYSVESA